MNVARLVHQMYNTRRVPVYFCPNTSDLFCSKWALFHTLDKSIVQEHNKYFEMAVNVLDRYYLAITLLITVAYQLVFFVTTVAFKFDKLNDFAG